MSVHTEDLDKAAVLAALWNAARHVEMGGFRSPESAEPLTVEDARALLEEKQEARFDILRGRWLKVTLGDSEFDPFFYDSENGQGAAARVVERLRGGEC